MSQRAQEADAPVPGFDTSRLQFTPSDLPFSVQAADSPVSLRLPDTRASVSRPSAQRAPKAARGGGRKKLTMATRRAPASHPPRAAANPPKAQDYLASLPLKIYDWPYPLPTDLPALAEFHKTWKTRQDAAEAAADRDPELDDWHEKCGRPEAYRQGFSDASLEYSIARSFILRAKRAFRAGRSWAAFEDEELAIDSMEHARAVADPARRALEMEEAVDNGLRLAIFACIRVRLCREIWLQPCPSERATATHGQAKKDSLVAVGKGARDFGAMAKARGGASDATSEPSTGIALSLGSDPGRLDNMTEWREAKLGVLDSLDGFVSGE